MSLTVRRCAPKVVSTKALSVMSDEVEGYFK